MTTQKEGASILKTIIAFRNSTILRLMTPRKAAANALICFALFPGIRAKATSEPLSSQIVNTGAYDVMKFHELELEKKGSDDYIDYVEGLTLSEIETINSAYTALSEMMCEHDELPVTGGKAAVDRIYKAISNEGVH